MKISFIKGSDDHKLFVKVINLEGFTKSIFDEDDHRVYLDFHEDELNILLRRLDEVHEDELSTLLRRLDEVFENENNEAAFGWFEDIKDCQKDWDLSKG